MEGGEEVRGGRGGRKGLEVLDTCREHPPTLRDDSDMILNDTVIRRAI